MRYKQRRRLYSQNFLRDPKLVTKLIRNSSIGKKDTVIEIGPGKGIITSELLLSVGKVIAVELDRKLYLYLREKFKDVKNLRLIRDDFLNFRLPHHPYKLFTNTPFVITADVVRKLTSDDNFQEAYLIVQREAAKKFIGIPYDKRNQMMATLLKPWFNITVFWDFERNDFVPRPKVDCVMLNIKRRETPLIPSDQRKLYDDFTLYKYNQDKVGKMNFVEFIEQFRVFNNRRDSNMIRKVEMEALRIRKSQKTLQKIHRTRKDRNWRKF